MSHIIKLSTEVKDLECARKAIESLCKVIEVRENDYYKGYSMSQGKADLMSQEKADLIFKIEGCPYEIGLIKNADGTYRIAYDPYQGHIEKHIGKDAFRLKQEYSYQKLMKEIRKRNLNARIVRQEIKDTQAIQLTVWA